MKDKETPIHDLSVHLEYTDSEVHEWIEHLVVDTFASYSHEAWLQWAAQVVQEKFPLLQVKRRLQVLAVDELSDFVVYMRTCCEEFGL